MRRRSIPFLGIWKREAGVPAPVLCLPDNKKPGSDAGLLHDATAAGVWRPTLPSRA